MLQEVKWLELWTIFITDSRHLKEYILKCFLYTFVTLFVILVKVCYSISIGFSIYISFLMNILWRLASIITCSWENYFAMLQKLSLSILYICVTYQVRAAIEFSVGGRWRQACGSSFIGSHTRTGALLVFTNTFQHVHKYNFP